MIKKLSSIFLLAYLLLMVGGCVSSKDVGLEQPQVTIDPAINKPLENFNQLTEAEQKSASEGGNQGGAKNNAQSNPNKEDLEMKHWKYNRDNAANAQASTQANANNASTSPSSSGGTQGAKVKQSSIKNYSTDNGDGLPATIQLLTEEDLQTAVKQLLKLGYLSGTKVTESDFNAALIQFQNAQKLRPSGLLDKETLNSLTSPKELVGPK